MSWFSRWWGAEGRDVVTDLLAGKLSASDAMEAAITGTLRRGLSKQSRKEKLGEYLGLAKALAYTFAKPYLVEKIDGIMAELGGLQ